MGIICVTEQSPVQAYKYLSKKGRTLLLLKDGNRISSMPTDVEFILVPAMDTLSKNKTLLLSSKSHVILFDHSQASKSLSIPSVRKLDAYQIRKLESYSNSVSFKRVDLGKTLLKNTRSSIVGQVINQLFRIRDLERRDSIKRSILNFYLNNKPLEIGMFKKFENLKSVLESSTSQALFKAIQRVKYSNESLVSVAKQYKVSAYDMRYIMKKGQSNDAES